ncbi:hypothetical protein KHQ88_01830 [Mycoplasmatota bacterium]|nr:hypothetical protein KHQ88_01830 [Mycoplasmatota bacterium]
MKKILTLFLFAFIFTSFIACDAFIIPENISTEEPVTDDNELTTSKPITEDLTSDPSSTDVDITHSQPFTPEGYSLLQDELESFGIPSIGSVNVLVFAVDFPDSKHSSSQASIDDIETAFNGSSNDLDFESVRSYYQKSSYDQLHINADVYGYYTLSKTASYYERESEKYMEVDPYTGEYIYDEDEVTHVESDIINELLTHYDDQINYSDYDSNDDGFIDGIYLIYNHPSEPDTDLWWAYQYNYAYNDLNQSSFDGVSPDYYTWASNDFLNEGDDDINARTYIHETGHMLGLDDYYDYSTEDTYNNGGLGTYMMDYTIGDHDPFSKILLGWVKPIVIESSATIDISSSIESQDVLLIIDEWKGTIFDEYLLLTYYKPIGLNSYDPEFIFTQSGINIFHVSAEIGDGYLTDSYYYSIFNHNNTDTEDKLIDIIEADMNENIEELGIVENSDLFQEGQVLNYSIYPSYRWYDDRLINFTVSIDHITYEKARITISYK